MVTRRHTGDDARGRWGDQAWTIGARLGRMSDDEGTSISDDVQLRTVEPTDLERFLEYEHDPENVRRSKFPARDRDVFMNHWHSQVLGDPTNLVRTCVVDGKPAGHVVAWWAEGRRFLGYVFGREYWGRGIGTKALAL